MYWLLKPVIPQAWMSTKCPDPSRFVAESDTILYFSYVSWRKPFWSYLGNLPAIHHSKICNMPVCADCWLYTGVHPVEQFYRPAKKRMLPTSPRQFLWQLPDRSQTSQRLKACIHITGIVRILQSRSLWHKIKWAWRKKNLIILPLVNV